MYVSKGLEGNLPGESSCRYKWGSKTGLMDKVSISRGDEKKRDMVPCLSPVRNLT